MLNYVKDINRQDLKNDDLNFHSLEVVDRVTETQLHVGKNISIE